MVCPRLSVRVIGAVRIVQVCRVDIHMFCRVWVVYIVLWCMRVCALGVLCVAHLGRGECVLCVLYMCVLPV